MMKLYDRSKMSKTVLENALSSLSKLVVCLPKLIREDWHKEKFTTNNKALLSVSWVNFSDYKIVASFFLSCREYWIRPFYHIINLIHLLETCLVSPCMRGSRFFFCRKGVWVGGVLGEIVFGEGVLSLFLVFLLCKLNKFEFPRSSHVI